MFILLKIIVYYIILYVYNTINSNHAKTAHRFCGTLSLLILSLRFPCVSSIPQTLSSPPLFQKTWLWQDSQTKAVRAGSCQYCNSYNSWTSHCARGYSVDYRSYIEYECEKAVEAGIKIVVLYNATTVDKSKCPDAVKTQGTHLAMMYTQNGIKYWNYSAIKDAIQN